MKLTYAEWKEHKDLLNEFGEHNNSDGDKAREFVRRIKSEAKIELPDDLYKGMEEFKSDI